MFKYLLIYNKNKKKLWFEKVNIWIAISPIKFIIKTKTIKL